MNNGHSDYTDYCLGILDFSYAPMALGDCITWQINTQIEAIERGCSKIAYHLVADPSFGTFTPLQPELNRSNYPEHIANLMPTLSAFGVFDSVSVWSNKTAFNSWLMEEFAVEQPSWPKLPAHFARNLDFNTHKKINKYYFDHGIIPLLKIPLSTQKRIQIFRENLFADKTVVTVNARRRYFGEAPADLARDADIDQWVQFFDVCQTRYPNVQFLVCGANAEIPRAFYERENVFCLRRNGFLLAEEIAWILSSDLFMGSSSGYAAVATFSDIPYVITSHQKSVAAAVEVPAGAPRYPFGQRRQLILWQKETTEGLLQLLELQLADRINGQDEVALLNTLNGDG